MKPSSPDLVTVFTADDQSALAKAKVILDAAEVRYSTRNDRYPDIASCGRMVAITGFTGPPEIQVQSKDKDRAKELLRIQWERHDV